MLRPRNRHFGGQTWDIGMLRPRNRCFGGQTWDIGMLCPRNCRFDGQTLETDVRSRHSSGGAALRLSSAAC